MCDAGIQVDVQSVYGIYVAALPSEYELEIRELNGNQVLDRNGIINRVQAQYDLLGKKKKSSPAAHALVANGRGGAGGCLLYTSPSPRDGLLSRMPSSA